MIELPLAASTSYAGFQNGLSKAIVSIRKLIWTFSTGSQFVAGRCLYSNEVNNVKDSFLPCEASALFQQVYFNLLSVVTNEFPINGTLTMHVQVHMHKGKGGGEAQEHADMYI